MDREHNSEPARNGRYNTKTSAEWPVASVLIKKAGKTSLYTENWREYTGACPTESTDNFDLLESSRLSLARFFGFLVSDSILMNRFCNSFRDMPFRSFLRSCRLRRGGGVEVDEDAEDDEDEEPDKEADDDDDDDEDDDDDDDDRDLRFCFLPGSFADEEGTGDADDRFWTPLRRDRLLRGDILFGGRRPAASRRRRRTDGAALRRAGAAARDHPARRTGRTSSAGVAGTSAGTGRAPTPPRQHINKPHRRHPRSGRTGLRGLRAGWQHS
jgi:hypothetical protein